jgi:hypothetical protein
MLTKRSFVLAGNATFTVKSLSSGNHITYKVKKGKDESAPHFVSVLTGTDNESDFSYLGTIFPSGEFRRTAKSKISADAPSAKGFEWVWRNIESDNLATRAEFLPACQCARCGRKLTNPTSVEQALGPECAGKMGF